jgi:hypothetical protein
MPDADERPVMQDLKTGLTDMGQFPGDKTGAISGVIPAVEADSQRSA